jgi:hypothetical protein
VKKPFLIFAALALACAAFLFLRPLVMQTSTTESHRAAVTDPAMPTPDRPSPPNVAQPSEFTTNVQDRTQADTLESVLEAHNDNDMRLDTDLKVLSAGAKELFRQKYEKISAEKRNERGTVIFLLGRNITHELDLAFMSKVLAEPPCRSMQNCASDPPHSSDIHGDNGVDVTLAYPQLQALKSLERVLEAGKTGPLYEHALEEVHRATQSPVKKVADMARSIESKFSRS